MLTNLRTRAAMGIRFAYISAASFEIAYGSSLSLDFYPVLRTGRQADSHGVSRSVTSIYFGRQGLEIARIVAGFGGEEGQRFGRSCENLEVESHRQNQQRSDTE